MSIGKMNYGCLTERIDLAVNSPRLPTAIAAAATNKVPGTPKIRDSGEARSSPSGRVAVEPIQSREVTLANASLGILL